MKLYKSCSGVIQSKTDWYNEAIRFYKDIESEMPRDWWDRWVRRLKLEVIS